MLDAVFPQKSVMTNIMGLWFDWSKCVAHLLQTTSVENTVNTREITPTRHHVTLLVIFSSDFLNLTNISCVTLTLQQTSSWQLCPLQTSFWWIHDLKTSSWWLCDLDKHPLGDSVTLENILLATPRKHTPSMIIKVTTPIQSQSLHSCYMCIYMCSISTTLIKL